MALQHRVSISTPVSGVCQTNIKFYLIFRRSLPDFSQRDDGLADRFVGGETSQQPLYGLQPDSSLPMMGPSRPLHRSVMCQGRATKELGQQTDGLPLVHFLSVKFLTQLGQNIRQMTMFIEDLDSSIQPIVSQYRQDNPDVSYLRLANYAKAHGSASRAKYKNTKKVTIQAPATLRVGSKPKVPHPVRKNSAAVHLADSISGSEGRGAQKSNESYYEGAFVAEGAFIGKSDEIGYGEDGSFGTSTVLTRTYTKSSNTEATDPWLAFRGRGHTPAPRVPMEDKGTAFRRPGWTGRPTARGPPRSQYLQKKHSLICYHCYEKGHGAPTCLLSFREMNRVLKNYEALSPIERLGIPSRGYLKIKNWFDLKTESTPSAPADGSNRPSPGPAAGPWSQGRKPGSSRETRERGISLES